MDTGSNLQVAIELRYALQVLDERSHLGLDDEFAGILREILLRRIAEADAVGSANFPVFLSAQGC